MKNLNVIFSTLKHNDRKGFTLVENLSALIILSITLTIMFPAFANFGLQNIKNRKVSDAVAIASSRLNELRIKSVSELNTELGKKNITLDSTSRYKLTQYICTDLFNNPLDPTNPDNTCSKTLVDGDLARQILLKVEDKNDPNRVLYQIQTVFTRLSS